MLFHLLQTVYWLALSTWFGGVLFIAIAAPIIFRTVREHKPILPHILQTNLENQHGTLLAGSIVGNLLQMLYKVAMVCAVALVLCMVGQGISIDFRGAGNLSSPIMFILRVALLLAALIMTIYDRRVVWPKITRYRQQYIDHADEPEIANPAKEQFDRYHHESVTILGINLFLLLGIIFFSVRMTFTQVISR